MLHPREKALGIRALATFTLLKSLSLIMQKSFNHVQNAETKKPFTGFQAFRENTQAYDEREQ